MSNEECRKVDCKKTFVSGQTQGQFQGNLTAIMDKLNSSVKKGSCKETLRKLACASYTPPCYGNRIQTLCKYRCTQLFYDCPEAFNITEVSSYCAEPAEGNTNSGFCKLTRWPSARHWQKSECYRVHTRLNLILPCLHEPFPYYFFCNLVGTIPNFVCFVLNFP